ncbi:MAG: NmrA/HSCARG family protein [Ignavibacteriaceae bacterium]|nr:NmrA/HSCARG family protein [Ignavibacteriaceae bacterium]
MADKKIIAVLGATGAQGGGLVRAILNDKSSEFSVRALVHNPNSEKAKALLEMGVEVVTVDVDNYESLRSGFSNAYGVYAVTFFWHHFSAEKEILQAESIAKAAKETNVKHIIWSTLEDTRKWIPLTDSRMPTLQEKYKVPHFDGKGSSDKFFTDLNLPVTFLYASFYWENFIYFGLGPKRGPDGRLALTIPMGDKKLAGIASDDIGKCAYAIFKKGNEFFGKKIGIASDHLTIQEMADLFAKTLGEEVVYNKVSFDMFRSFGFPGADEAGNMFQFYHDCDKDVNGLRDVGFTKLLNPELKNLEVWLKENKTKIPVG